MTTEEMQRFLTREALRGTDELEAWQALAQILGISYPAKEDDEKTEK